MREEEEERSQGKRMRTTRTKRPKMKERAKKSKDEQRCGSNEDRLEMKNHLLCLRNVACCPPGALKPAPSPRRFAPIAPCAWHGQRDCDADGRATLNFALLRSLHFKKWNKVDVFASCFHEGCVPLCSRCTLVLTCSKPLLATRMNCSNSFFQKIQPYFFQTTHG